jgi:pilus assembly protein Flp/PilA
LTKILGAAKKFSRDQRGASIVEYALMFALITIVCLGAMSVLGAKINSFFSSASTSI